MKFKHGVLFAAGSVATVFVLAVSMDGLRALFPCEGFGCVGLGVIALLIAGLIVVAFLIGGVLWGPPPRWASGLFAGAIATLAMLLAFGALYGLNQRHIAQGWEAHRAACAQAPQLCPEDASR
ncbi:MAG: hypothetical protein ACOZB0_08605 [Pseudomonadota bacterium]